MHVLSDSITELQGIIWKSGAVGETTSCIM